jgi:hypothetical protein
VARTIPGVIVVADVDVDAAEVAVADTHPPTLRESPTMQTTATPSRFLPRRRSTTTMWYSPPTQLGPLAGPMATTRDLMTVSLTTILAIAPS